MLVKTKSILGSFVGGSVERGGGEKMGIINKIADVRRPQQKNLPLPARAEKR